MVLRADSSFASNLRRMDKQVSDNDNDVSGDVTVGSVASDELLAPLLSGYRPRQTGTSFCSPSEWETVADVVRRAVGALRVDNPQVVRVSLTAMARLATWAQREGLPLDVGVLLSDRVIEAHVASLGRHNATLRSLLRRVRDANGIEPDNTAVVAYRKRGQSEPFSFDDVTALLLFADSLSNQHRRRNLSGAVLLAAGFGIVGSDLRGRTNSDAHFHGSVRHVRTENRCAPVASRLAAKFEEYLAWCGDGPFISPTKGPNITDHIGLWVREQPGVPRFSTWRLRGFYIVEHLNAGTPLTELLAITGLSSAESFDAFLPYCDPGTSVCPLTDGAR